MFSVACERTRLRSCDYRIIKRTVVLFTDVPINMIWQACNILFSLICHCPLFFLCFSPHFLTHGLSYQQTADGYVELYWNYCALLITFILSLHHDLLPDRHTDKLWPKQRGVCIWDASVCSLWGPQLSPAFQMAMVSQHHTFCSHDTPYILPSLAHTPPPLAPFH